MEPGARTAGPAAIVAVVSEDEEAVPDAGLTLSQLPPASVDATA
jgi:hypothetical protein